ncbi:phosphopyruvate hydratase [Candidatus Woesearchaeota archaeon]|nr:phosphopyruvate hydratase [Candidatus Woesearchaeota archaeon]
MGDIFLACKITKIKAREVLDSRGNPTVEVQIFSKDKNASAIVPSGASTGIHEAHELRDGGSRYMGKGVQKALKNVKIIEKSLKGMDACAQKEIDNAMIALDNTENKSRLGANAILGVSMAAARLASECKKMPLYKHIAALYKNKRLLLPVPFCNIINGGKHAGGKLRMQEFMVVPNRAKSFSEAAQLVSETYHILKGIIEKKYGKSAVNVGDEGGFAPPLTKAEEALTLITKAINEAGYEKKISIALDPAASEFYNKNSIYLLHKQFTSEKLAEHYIRLSNKYNIISIEDPFEQDDFSSFSALMKKARFQIVGDDLLVTNTKRIISAAEKRLCNALLLKVNQIGTLTESLAAARLSMDHGWKVMVSHRSGETEDSFISDLASGIGCGQIKLGAPCRSDRTSKYNRLLRIEEELGSKARYARF